MKNCAICKHGSFMTIFRKKIYHPIDHLLVFEICNHCGYIRQKDPIPEKVMNEYYRTVPNDWHKKGNTEHYRRSYQFITEHITPKSIIDVGCGNCEFLMMFEDSEKTGIDPADIIPPGEVRYHRSTIEDMPDDFPPAEIVCVIHTLEHAYDIEFFAHCLSLISSEYIYIAVPCIEALPVGTNNPFPFTHISLFSRSTLNRLFYNHGFEPVKWRIDQDNDRAQIHALYVRRQEFKEICDHFMTFKKTASQKIDNAVALIYEHITGESLLWGAGNDCLNIMDEINQEVKVKIKVVDKHKAGKVFGQIVIHDIKGHAPEKIFVAVNAESIVNDIKKDACILYPGVPVINLYSIS